MRLIPPPWLQEAFRRDYFKVIGTDEFNWVMARSDTDEPFILPKKGRFVSSMIIQAALAYAAAGGAQLDQRIEQVTEEYYAHPDPRPQSPKHTAPPL